MVILTMGLFQNEERSSFYKSNLKTYDTFSESSGLLFYNIPKSGVNPFHGYSSIERQRGIFDETKQHGNYVIGAGEKIQGEHFGVPLRSDSTSKTFTSLRTQWEDKTNLTVNDFWLSWRKTKHTAALLRSVSEREKVKEHSVKSLPTSQKRVLLVTMVVMELIGGVILSMLSPFFPLVAEEKGVSTTVTGVVMATCEIVMVFLSPIYGNFIHKTGTRFTYVAGSLVAGTCAVLFAFTIHAPDDGFIPLCIVILVVQGAGTAAYCTTTYSILVHTFPKNVASVFGALETAQGAGLMAGPFLGSVFYQIGGYQLPFFVMGGFTMLISAATTLIVPRITVKKRKSEESGKFSMLRLVIKPRMLLCGILHFSSAFTFGILDVTLALHLEKHFNATQIAIGVLFVSVFIGYVIFAPLWGRVVDKWPHTSYVILYVGFIFSIAMLFCAGPAPYLPFLPSESLLALLISFILLGIGLSTCVVTFSLIVACAKASGLPDDISTYGKVSGFTESCYCFGSCMGPLLGGVMYENIGWAWTVTSPAYIMAGALLILFVYLMVQKFTVGFNFLDSPHEMMADKQKQEDHFEMQHDKRTEKRTDTSEDVHDSGLFESTAALVSKQFEGIHNSFKYESDSNEHPKFGLTDESDNENCVLSNTM